MTKVSGNKTTCINVPAVFSVTASGTRPLKYQWMKGTAAAPGTGTDSVYQITPLSSADEGSYYCVVSNGISPDAQSQNMTLTVNNPPAISGIAANPSTMPVCPSTKVTFTVTATGTVPLTFTWKKNGTAIANGPNAATYSINSVVVSDSGQYSCSVSNGCTPVANSSNVQLKITVPPVFSAPTKDTTFKKWAGDSLTFTVVAYGTGTLSYQWYKGNTSLGAGAASPVLKITPITLADSGTYTCAVSNGCNPVVSKAILLKVKTVVKVAAGDGHSLILMNDGTLWACGNNGNGELGVSSISQSKTPVLVTTSVKSMSAGSGGNNSLIIKTDGTLWTCGDNFYGQLADGTTNNRSTSLLNRMPNVLNAAAGQNFSFILKTDGTLLACGSNAYGQLGDSSRTDRSPPVPIMTGVGSMAAGGLHSLILKTDGTLWACGYNGLGQLGDGTTVDRLKPYQLWAGVQSICAGGTYSLVLQTDGTLLGCGFNVFGELGDGSKTNQQNLVQIRTDVQSISAGSDHSLILKTDGTLLGCGTNSNGQLGDNTTIDKYTPVPIMPDVQSMAGGNNYSLIIKKDGTLWACGANDLGQLGDGTIIERHSPVQIKF